MKVSDVTRKCCFALALLLSPLSGMADEKAQLIDRMIEAYGGEQAVARLNEPYRQVWDVVAVVRQMEGTDVREIDLPDRLVIELTYPNSIERREVDGDEVTVTFDNAEPVIVSSPKSTAVLLQRARLYNPLVLRDKLSDLTLTEVEGMPRLTLDEGGLVTHYFVDPFTGLVSMTVGTLNIQGMTMEFRTAYGDYRAVNGVMVAHREERSAGGVLTAVTHLRETQFGK